MGAWSICLAVLGPARAPARLVLLLARLGRLARRHLARRHLVRRLVSANSSNVNMQHIKRDQPKATRMHVRATRASRALRQTCRARACDCQSRDSVQTGSKHAKVQATLRQSECIRACVCNVSITNEARRRSACVSSVLYTSVHACEALCSERDEACEDAAHPGALAVECTSFVPARGGAVECFLHCKSKK